jgi:hypothetical protein
MITKFKTDYRSPRRNYDSDYDYVGDNIMINPRQRNTLVELISRNFQEDDREVRLMELENLTSLEAEDHIFQYLSATWN